MKDNLNLAEKLKFYRKSAKLTQQQVADALGIQRSAYAYYEIDKTAPKLNTLANIAKLYNVTIDELVNEEDYSVVMQKREELDKEIGESEFSINDAFNDLSTFEKSVVLRLRIMSADDRRRIVKELNLM